ncbi:MAG: carbohydrate binding domain-containing protein, partial [Clostridia bacterium]|nr:carbohydrate binding domain-containing protein [Clostridia bacterium]
MKKLISILLCLTVTLSLIGAVPAVAAKETYIPMEFISNGDMEKLGMAGAAWEGKGVASNEQAHSGKKSLKMASTSEETKDTASIWAVEGLVPGQTYTYSAWIYILENKGGEAYIKIGWLNENNVVYEEVAVATATGLAPGKWHQLSGTVMVPDGVTLARPMLKNYGYSTVYYDDVSLYGNTTQSTLDKLAKRDAQLAEAEKVRLFYEKDYLSQDLEAYQDTSVPNTFYNPSFEEVDESGIGAVGWAPIGTWGEWCSVTDEEAHSGERSMKITGVSRYNWVRQYIESAKGQFVPGQQYVLSAWVKYKEVVPGKGAFIKIEPNASAQLESPVFPFDDQEWHQIKWVFTSSVDDNKIGVLFRIWGAGEIYVDDVAIHPGYKVGELAELRSEVFFYTENEIAEAELWIDNANRPIPVGSTVEFKIKDGEEVLLEETLPAKSKTKWEYPVMTLAKKKTPYTIEATYKDADGTVLATTDPWEVYRYDRPKLLSKDGTLVIDGEPFYPYVGYQAPEKYADLADEIGINVMRTWEKYKTVKDVKPILDKLAKKGYKVPICLYGSETAGYPTVIERTIEYVEAFKDHPAVLCWMIMDEPAAHYGGSISTYKEMLYWCKQAYITIRNIDDVHPIYMVESRKHIDEPYYHSAKYTDIFVIDPYAANYEWQLLPEAIEKSKEAMASVPDYKPVWGLADTYKIYEPGAMHKCDDTRHRFYSFVWEGLKGVGLFGLNYSTYSMYDAPDGLWDDFKQ